MSAESRDREDFEEWKKPRRHEAHDGTGCNCIMSTEEQFAVANFLRKRQAEPAPDPRPVVHQGEVMATLHGELAMFFRRINMADAFEKKVTEAAKSPAAWLLLREELNPSKDPAP